MKHLLKILSISCSLNIGLAGAVGAVGGVGGVAGLGLGWGGSGVGQPDQASKAQVLESGPQGSILIRATQGTPQGGSLASVPVTVTIVHKNEKIKTVQTVLADNGTVIVEKIPVGIDVRALVWITYKDVQYQGASKILSTTNPNDSVQVVVYEPTLDEPQWRVVTRQVGVARTQDGVRVKEFVLVENTSSVTWLGGEPTRQDKRTTITLQLPENATDIQLGQGFHGWCCASIQGQLLHVQMPIMPGKKPFRYDYRIPTTSSKIALNVAVQAPTSELLIFMPDDGSEVQADNLIPQGAEMINGMSLRKYRATGLAPGQEAGVRFAAALKPVAAHSASRSKSPSITSLFLMIGGGLILVGATAVLLRVPKRPSALNA